MNFEATTIFQLLCLRIVSKLTSDLLTRLSSKVNRLNPKIAWLDSRSRYRFQTESRFGCGPVMTLSRCFCCRCRSIEVLLQLFKNYLTALLLLMKCRGWRVNGSQMCGINRNTVAAMNNLEEALMKAKSFLNYVNNKHFMFIKSAIIDEWHHPMSIRINSS